MSLSSHNGASHPASSSCSNSDGLMFQPLNSGSLSVESSTSGRLAAHSRTFAGASGTVKCSDTAGSTLQSDSPIRIRLSIPIARSSYEQTRSHLPMSVPVSAAPPAPESVFNDMRLECLSMLGPLHLVEVAFRIHATHGSIRRRARSLLTSCQAAPTPAGPAPGITTWGSSFVMPAFRWSSALPVCPSPSRFHPQSSSPSSLPPETPVQPPASSRPAPQTVSAGTPASLRARPALPA
jgi:hypothetical protein